MLIGACTPMLRPIPVSRSQQQLLDLCGRTAVIVKAALGAGLQALDHPVAASDANARPALERALLQLPEALTQHGVKAQMATAIARAIHRQLLPNHQPSAVSDVSDVAGAWARA